jgi:TP901 family phage tail tape measure protein
LADNSVTLRIGADPTKLQNGLKQSSAAIDSFGSRARASIARVGSSLKGLADRMVTPFNSLVLGGGLGMAIKNVGDLSESLMYYGMAAKKSDADTKVFRDSLHKMAVETGVDADTILAGISRIGEVTGDFDFSEQMGETLAKAAKASGASVDELAAVAASMKTSMGWGAEQIASSFNSLIIQGDQGSYTLQKFAAEGKALLAAASSFGIKSQDQFANFGAYLQVMNTSIKSEAELTTSVSSLFNELIGKAKDLKKIGVRVFDKDGNLNDFDDIMRQLMEKTDGNIKKISPMFGASALKALTPVMAEYKNGWQTLDAITKSGQDGMNNTVELDKRFQKTSDDFNTNVNKMKAVALKFADTNLAGPVNQLSDALKYLGEHQGLVTAGFKAMTVAAGALVAVKVGEFVKSFGGLVGDLKGFWSRKNGNATADAIEAAAGGVQKVFVVNMGGGMGSANYMDDDDLPVTTRKTATAMETTTKEVGRFRQGLSNARAGLNRLGGSALGGPLLGIATNWALGQIYNFGQAFLEWRQVVANSRDIATNTIDANAKSFEERYGKNAHAKRYDETLKAINEEETSFLPSQKKLDKLYDQLDVSRELMKRDIASGAQRVSAQEYMKNLTVAPNIVINLDASNNRFTAQSDGGKPANIRVKNTPGMGR